MPNHVTHRVTITGPSANIDAFVAAFIVSGTEKNWKGEDEDFTLFDFNKIIPMPDLLKGTESSTAVSDGLIVLGRTDIPDMFGSTSAQRMLEYPWVKEAGVTDLEGLKALLLKRDPNCVAIAEAAIKAYEACGHTSWYSWSVQNWGTKWNSYSYELVKREPELLEFTFDTAWSPPEPVFEALAKRDEVKGLDIKIAAFDEGWGFAYIAKIGDGYCMSQDLEATDELYERVYGEPPEHDDEEEDGEPDAAIEGATQPSN